MDLRVLGLCLVIISCVIKNVTSAGSISWDSGCGSTKGCFPSCSGGCEYLVTWQDTGSGITFTMKAEESGSDKYLAIAFSDDLLMGDDSVVSCLVAGSTVESSHNDGTDNDALSPTTLGLTSTSVSQANGLISCSFTRSYSEASDSRFFDINKDYLLMLVVGDTELDDGAYKIKDHDKIPWSSDGKVDFNSFNIYSLYKLNSSLVKLHGISAMLAWLLLSVIGIFAARFNKEMLHKQKLLGTKIWFQVHRTTMVLVLLLVVIAFIAIFVELGGYSQILDEGIVAGHPIIGIIITVLTLFNPILALLRPAADHKYRWVFFWVHMITGILAQILGIFAVFFGYNLERAGVPSSALWITVVHQVLVGAYTIFWEVMKCQQRKNSKGKVDGTPKVDGDVKPDNIEMKEKQELETEPEPPAWPFYLFVAVVIVLFGLTLAILGIIAAA